MGLYVFFHSQLLPAAVPLDARRAEWGRSLSGTGPYAVAGLLAWVWAPVALVVLAVMPMLFVVPTLLGEG